jgi:hypothetical protein
MSCPDCGSEVVNAPLETYGSSNSYGVSYQKIFIKRPQQLKDKWDEMNKLLIDALYDGNRQAYEDDRYSFCAPENNTEYEAIMRYSEANPTVSLGLCVGCGSTSVTTDLEEIFSAIDVLTQWINAESEARQEKQKAKQKKIRDEKRKNYEKQISALQKKLNKLNED